MMIFVIFVCGIANFAMHRAVMESNHRMIADVRESMTRFMGPYGTYVLEFFMLLSALIFANLEMTMSVVFYGFYTAINGAGAWFVLSQND